MARNTKIGPTEGSLSISRRSTDEGEMVVVRITDEGCGRNVATIEMKIENFARALMGQAFLTGTYELDNLDKAGKVRETMEYLMPDKGDKPVVPDELKAKGWEYENGFKNHHCSVYEGRKQFYRTTLRRYVAPKKKDKK